VPGVGQIKAAVEVASTTEVRVCVGCEMVQAGQMSHTEVVTGACRQDAVLVATDLAHLQSGHSMTPLISTPLGNHPGAYFGFCVVATVLVTILLPILVTCKEYWI